MACARKRAKFGLMGMSGMIGFDPSRSSQTLGRWPSVRSIVMLSQVPHHSAIFPLSMRNTAPKSNCTLTPEGGNGPIDPCCVPSYVAPYGYEIIFGNEMRDRLNRI